MSIIIDNIRRRLHEQNKNFLGAIVGDTGSGKSYNALTLAKLIDPEFTIRNVVFNPEQFLALLNSGKLKRGSVVVFDEAGVGIPAREWFSLQNKLLGYVLQTFRHENIAVIFTLPNISFLDIQARRLFHAIIETHGINFKTGYSRTKIFIIKHNPLIEKDFRVYPRIDDGGRKKICWYNIPHPPKPLTRAYERIKKKFAVGLRVDVERQLKDQANSKKHKHFWVYKAGNKVYQCKGCGAISKREPAAWKEQLKNSI